jgi:hypothetical protein
MWWVVNDTMETLHEPTSYAGFCHHPDCLVVGGPFANETAASEAADEHAERQQHERAFVETFPLNDEEGPA